MLRVLFVGDVYGSVGRRMLSHSLPNLRQELQPDFVIVNMENSAGGVGIHRDAADKALMAGADCMTLGNHAWHHRDVFSLMGDEASYPLVRPLNYSNPDTAGVGFRSFTVSNKAKQNERLTVVNLLGRVFMEPVANPFLVMDEFLQRTDLPELGNIFVDFHAEATSEKAALARYLDGRVAAIIGTHTHVPTADTRILRSGTAFQSDAGFTGPLESIIGADPKGPLQKFLTERPQRFQPADSKAELNAVLIEMEQNKALSIERHRLLE